MNTEEIKQVLNKQKNYFHSHTTKEVGFRIKRLKKLKKIIKANEQNIYDALWKDLHKSSFEAYATEIGIVLEEIGIHIRNLKRWAQKQHKWASIVHFKSDSMLIPEPFGHVLIIAPWNYPFQLLINPLVGAISAGNVVTLKPSPYTPETADVMEKIIKETFEEDYVTYFKGGREVNQLLLEQKYDMIFFTGSPYLGQIVMEKASKHLTPVVLELGGKSPCIVDCDANINIAARRITWGKFINAGQTCIAPDYLFVHKDIKEKLFAKMKYYIEKSFGTEPQQSVDYPRIVNTTNVKRLEGLMKAGKIITGGQTNIDDRYIAPTIIDEIKPEDPIMQEEIFGPILPAMEFSDINEVINFINSKPKPLAFYYFSQNKKKQNTILNQTTSGGGCINDTLMHIANPNLPFGGVGNSGMGRYHGKYSFDTFSNHRAILKKATWLDVPIRYAPYGKKLKLVKYLLH